MLPIHRRTLVRSALLPVVALTTVAGSTVALADTGRLSGLYYTMHLSSAAATVRPGGTTKTVISFTAGRRLYGYRVDLSVTGLPEGATASFSPRRPRVGGHSTLTITTAPSSAAGAFALTISAIISPPSSDPIGTTTTFGLTIGGS